MSEIKSVSAPRGLSGESRTRTEQELHMEMREECLSCAKCSAHTSVVRLNTVLHHLLEPVGRFRPGELLSLFLKDIRKRGKRARMASMNRACVRELT